MSDLQIKLQNLTQQAFNQNHRYWVWISGDKHWCLQQAERFSSANNVLYIGNDADYTAKQSRTLLGQESDNLIYDAFSGIDADALAITAGTVKAGGLFILLSPPSEEWPTTEDSPYSYFIQRLCQILKQDSQCYKIEQNTPLTEIPGPNKLYLNKKAPSDSIYKNLDQENTVAAIHHVITGHRRRPLVITADRGRGKTSALGIAAAQLLQKGLKKILLTAPQWQSVSALFDQLKQHLPEGVIHKQTFIWQNKQLSYLPIDRLIQEQPDSDLLLVDEAAAIPTPLLEQLLRYSRVVFSTTVQGYEGSGRGFQIRFFKKMDQKTPNWKHIKLNDPIRWGTEDPLENSLYKALLFNTPAPITTPDPGHTELFCIHGEQLIKNENLLQQLFGLLVQAHYRTSPADLQAILDTTSGGCLILRDKTNQQLLAAAFYVYEGDLPLELCQKIWLGNRRPKGHLIPQSLAAHSGFYQAGQFKGLRVVRIAAQPELQRKGLGKQLLDKLNELALEKDLDFIGSSFGATEDVLDFWQKSNYQLFRLGLHLDASSGTHSALVWKPLSKRAITLNHKLQHQWQKQLPHLLSNQFQNLPCSLIQKLFKDLDINTLDNQDWLDVYSYGFGRRGFDQVAYVLSLFTQHIFQNADTLNLSQQEQKVLCHLILQQHSLNNTTYLLGLSGKKDLDKNLRSTINRLFILMAPTHIKDRLTSLSLEF